MCNCRVWLSGLGIVGLVGSLLAKTYRISKYVLLHTKRVVEKKIVLYCGVESTHE